jgi:acid phosphatase
MWNYLNSNGVSMKWVSEDLPAVGSTVCEAYPYVRKHNPMPSFSTIPAYANQPLTYMDLQDPSTFSSLDEVICISPNMLNDMHDGSVRDGDDWLRDNFSKLIDWCMTNNSIFVVYYDETQTSGGQQNSGSYVRRACKTRSYC